MTSAYTAGAARVRSCLAGQFFQCLTHHLDDGGAEDRGVDPERVADNGQLYLRRRSVTRDLLHGTARHDGLALDVVGGGGLGAPVVERRDDSALNLGGFLALAKLLEHHEDVPGVA